MVLNDVRFNRKNIKIQELRQSGIVKDFKTGCLFTKTFKDSFTGKDFVDWAMKNKNVEKDKAIEMGQELISRKFGYGLHKNEADFKYESDAIYQLGHVSSNALNADQVNNCAQRKAGDVAEDLRKLILQIFATFLSNDGKKVDYNGIRESPMFDTYKSMARELQRVDIKEFSR